MALVNPNELIYVILASEASIISEVTSSSKLRLYGPPGLPPDFSPRKAILYIPDSSGEADTHIPKRTKFFEFRCYGVTAVDADHVFGVLYDVLHRRSHQTVTLSNGTGIFLYSCLSGEASNMVEPVNDWQFVRAVFEVQFIEHTVTFPTTDPLPDAGAGFRSPLPFLGIYA